AGRVRPAASGGGGGRRRCLSAARHQGGHVLRVEEALRASGRPRGPARPPARGPECAVEESGRRPDARHAHAGGGTPPKELKPAQRRELAGWFRETFQIDIRRACGLAHLSRTAWYRRPSEARTQTVLRLRIRELAHARPRFGYLRIWVLLRRE